MSKNRSHFGNGNNSRVKNILIDTLSILASVGKALTREPEVVIIREQRSPFDSFFRPKVTRTVTEERDFMGNRTTTVHEVHDTFCTCRVCLYGRHR